MEKSLVTVRGSIEFRDAVMKLEREGGQICARLKGDTVAEYRVISGWTITLDDLLAGPLPPVRMEDLATALARADEAGEDVPLVEVFTLEDTA